MKATRRQELKANDLAQTIEDMREFFRQRGNYVLIGVVAVAVIAVIWVYVQFSATKALADAKREMGTLSASTDDEAKDTIARLEEIAAGAKDQNLVVETMRRRAAIAMHRAQAAEDGTPSTEFLDLARAAYDDILERFPNRDLDVGVALSGLATIEENLFVLDGDPAHKEAARKYLDRIIERPGLNQTPVQLLAVDRKNSLDQTFVQVALAPPAPAATPQGLSGPGLQKLDGPPAHLQQKANELLKKSDPSTEGPPAPPAPAADEPAPTPAESDSPPPAEGE